MMSLTNSAGAQDSNVQNTEIIPLSLTPAKVTPKRIRDLDIKPEALKLLEDNMGGKHEATSTDEVSLNRTAK